MRAPRLSFSEEFRDEWDKENKDPITMEFASNTITSRRKKTSEAENKTKETIDTIETNTRAELPWLNELLGCIL
ncbi:hypothetical protein NEAUS04_2258 [Nematocida ausubeli]|uniref:Uncharacterized protein n=1 Tax=Nematocida ausubeli (strain ATCC PRA-371 / ERTm2) TaxID=1913371 RepID=A0A086J2D8_NEMA1|nr:uncharacterized protein NESG_01426 [Nematocida ausubeli]KAI5132549.1 hypothetical protein NEAUS06_0198 [Nematocida ausubeli]KAI5138132.1 hypothetical protein NEAUS07_2280 [Nematocida ausubeli]KAI5138166.1 hypothetical protein NEAUS07_2302 [Nematocida ausubeli]KAI5150850.1 hypothetical protein NEAUS05_2315 [Nematocida ausubeli]KAI5150920.1 hypothetical protein NEAUS05_2337 [Nematocida ausubeli]